MSEQLQVIEADGGQVHQFGKQKAYLEGASSLVIPSSKAIFKPSADSKETDVAGISKPVKVVNWGADNALPTALREKVYKSPDMSAGMLFNVELSYGEGIQPVRYVRDGKKRVAEPVYDCAPVSDFFEQNAINPRYCLEQITDMNWFFNVFPEIIADKAGRNIVELTHKEAEFSRLSAMNEKTGKIDYHLYSAKWGESPQKEDIVPTPYLDPRRTFFDLQQRLKGKDRRFVVPVSFPTPGRTYYQKPYWYSIIESGWYDFAVTIPEFKKAILKNGMAIRFLIEIDEEYWTLLFSREGITSDDEKTARVTQEYKNLNDFLVGAKNAGKGWIAPLKHYPGMKEAKHFIRISEIKADFKGGEYLQDASDVSNIIAYAMGVHSGLIGSAPGKNSGSLSGTDKREMFIIKQALMKPFRDLILSPFYLIKQVNNWPKDIHFTIPNLVLTTLDENRESKETAPSKPTNPEQ